MFDKARLQEVLAQYKKVFVVTRWKDEKFKWEAVQCFQKHWDVNAANFAEMLELSLSMTGRLLSSHMNLPGPSIIEFSQQYPEEVRAMFLNLFDETREVYERMKEFKEQAGIILEKMNWGRAQHYQHENATSTYLWLRYPDKYYIFKYSEIKTVAEELLSDYTFSKGAYANNIRNAFRIYDEIADVIKKDQDLVNLFQSQLTDTCYPDPEMHTLANDVGFYISRYFSRVQKESAQTTDDAADENDPNLYSDDWYPSIEEYSPGFTKEQWLELLNNKEIIGPVWGGTLAAFFAMGGAATCSQVAERYNLTRSAIIGRSTQLAKRIYKVTQCPLLKTDDGKNSYWTILFQGKNAGGDVSGNYIWRLRPELFDALTEFDIMRYQWKIESGNSENDSDIHYWWLNANPKIWSFSSLGIGEVQSYTLYNENGNKRRIFQNFLDAKAGDMVIGYESYPVKQIVAIAKIRTAQDGEKILFEKVEGLTSPIDYATLRECPELEQMEYFQNPQGSLFKLTNDEYEFIVDLIRDNNPLKTSVMLTGYGKNDFLDEVYMTEASYENLVAVLRNKKNIILQGAPGVGKTFTARRLAWSIMGEMDESRIEFVQFHQNYSYEDFVMGYKPTGEGFELKYGVFYRFCQRAANQPDKDFFFIIDEINRGNLSKIFGELLMLIEKDYRKTKVTLAYNGLVFSVPDNVYIIGMMNTADRSLAMIDYALRRRFSFFDMEPGFDSEGFILYQNSLNNETFNELISRVKDLNKDIVADKSLGKGFCIGHSYFCGQDVCTDEWLHAVVNYDILPMLSEYWFDEPGKLQRWENILRGVFQ